MIVPIINSINTPDFAEYKYEIEESKIYFPDEWKKAEIYQEEMNNIVVEGNFAFFKNKRF